MANNRMTIERIKQSLAPNFPKIQGAYASESTLRLAVNVQGLTVKQIVFNVLENVGTTLGIERRLKINDVFTILNWGLYVMKAGTTTTASDTEISAAKRFTNPNALVFTTAGETAALMQIYNGEMQINVDRKTILTGYDSYRFYRVGDAQKGVGPAVITTDDSFPSHTYGTTALDPEVTINGGGTPEIVANMPNAATLSGTNSTNVVMLVLRGILFQNASQNNA